MQDILDKRLLIVMGKGGVGKSLAAAALAKLALKRGKTVLLVQINTKDKIAGYLGCEAADETLKEVMPGLFAVNIRPESAMKEYALLQVRLELIYKLVFENRAVRYFLRAVPALNDLVVMGKIFYHVAQTDEASDRPRYDLVIVDAPPTGHGLFLLRLPQVMSSVVSTGPIHREALAMLERLRDPDHTAINLVAIPEEMPVSETAEMYETIHRDYRMPLGALFVNAVFPRLFEPDDEGRLERLGRLLKDDPEAGELMRVARTATARRQMSERFIRELTRRVPLPQVQIPYFFTDRFDEATTERVATIIEAGLNDYHGH
ncbi:MAG: ATPase [Myxococcales bacterium]|nr:MAG: ATPase [Myxococcales bacterium]